MRSRASNRITRFPVAGRRIPRAASGVRSSGGWRIQTNGISTRCKRFVMHSGMIWRRTCEGCSTPLGRLRPHRDAAARMFAPGSETRKGGLWGRPPQRPTKKKGAVSAPEGILLPRQAEVQIQVNNGLFPKAHGDFALLDKRADVVGTNGNGKMGAEINRVQDGR